MSARLVPLVPQRALAHPAWWLGLAALALNDHVFKGSGALPAVVTGKLSDAAGLFVAPALFATVLRARRRWTVLACHGAVVVVFAAIKLSQSAAAAWCDLLQMVGIHWQLVVDATDLVAVASVALAYRVLVPGMEAISSRAVIAPTPTRLELAGLGVGLVFCAASDPVPTLQVSAPDGSDRVMADAFLYVPKDGTDLALGVAWPSSPLDCEAVRRDPKAAVATLTFERGRGFQGVLFRRANQALWPAERLPPDPTRACLAVQVGGSESTFFSIGSSTLEPTVVIWDTTKIPFRAIPRMSEDEGALPVGAVIVREANGRLSLEPHGPIVVVPESSADTP